VICSATSARRTAATSPRSPRWLLLGASAAVKALAVLPFVMTIGLDALELLVAFLQAYVFAMLTCMYLNDALHPGH